MFFSSLRVTHGLSRGLWIKLFLIMQDKLCSKPHLSLSYYPEMEMDVY